MDMLKNYATTAAATATNAIMPGSSAAKTMAGGRRGRKGRRGKKGTKKHRKRSHHRRRKRLSFSSLF
jgi:hypothetical protein